MNIKAGGWLHSAILVMQTVTICVGAFVIFAKLRTTPNDVLERVVLSETQILPDLESTKKRQAEILAILDGRAAWMQGVTDTLQDAGKARWHSYEAAAAWRQFLDANPNLNVPSGFLPYEILPDPLVLPPVPK